jgi:hypothetical protein
LTLALNCKNDYEHEHQPSVAAAICGLAGEQD